MRMFSLTAVAAALLFIGSPALQAADKSPFTPPPPVKKPPPSLNLPSPPAALTGSGEDEPADDPAPAGKPASGKPALAPVKKKTPVKQVTKTPADPKGTAPAVPASEALRKRMKLQTPKALTTAPGAARIGEQQVQPDIQRTKDSLTSSPLQERKGMTRGIPSTTPPGGNSIGSRSGGFGSAIGGQAGPGKYSESEAFKSQSGPRMPGAGQSPVQGQGTDDSPDDEITFTDDEIHDLDNEANAQEERDAWNEDHTDGPDSMPDDDTWAEIFTGDIGPENDPAEHADDEEEDTGKTHADGESTKAKRTVDGDTPDSSKGGDLGKGTLTRVQSGSPGVRGVPGEEEGEGGEVNRVYDMGAAIMDPAPGGDIQDGGAIRGANLENLGGQIQERINQGGGPVIISNQD